jgi:hypothetical protein
MSGPGIARRIAINEGTPRPRATGEREESVISAPGSRWSTTEHPIECCSGGWGSDGPEAASGALSDRSAGDRSVIPRAFLVRANPRPKRQNRSALDITPLNGRSPARAVASTKRSRSCPDLAELSAFHLLKRGMESSSADRQSLKSFAMRVSCSPGSTAKYSNGRAD